MRQRPGRAGRIGDGEPRRQAEMIESMREIGEQFLFAAEQMRRAGDIEKESIRAVLFAPERDSGRVARCPQCKTPQGGIVGGRIDGTNLQHRTFRPRVGELVANHQSLFLRRHIQGGDARSAGSIGGEDEWLHQDQLARLTEDATDCEPGSRAGAGSASAAARLKQFAT